LNACRLKQIRRLLLRATRWHAANYAATDKMQQVGQQASNKRFAGSRYVELDAAWVVSSLGIHSWRQRAASPASIPTRTPKPSLPPWSSRLSRRQQRASAPLHPSRYAARPATATEPS